MDACWRRPGLRSTPPSRTSSWVIPLERLVAAAKICFFRARASASSSDGAVGKARWDSGCGLRGVLGMFKASTSLSGSRVSGGYGTSRYSVGVGGL